MADGMRLPEYDVAGDVHAHLAAYEYLLLLTPRAWHFRHECLGLPAARSLEAEACIVSVGLFRQFYEGHLSHVLPYCLTLPATWRCN
jgi:hypothetical protein